MLQPSDTRHRRGHAFDRAYTGHFFTSEFVLIELANWLADLNNRPVFLELSRSLRSNRRTTILPAGSEWFAKGHALFSGRPDKEWSLTDCISFEMMREHGIADALTADRHFTQAGFNALLA